MKSEQEQADDVKRGYKIVLETVNHHGIDVVMPQRIMLEQSESTISYSHREVGNVIDNKRQDDDAAHHHVTRREVCLHVVPIPVVFGPGTAILDRELDSHPNVKNHRSQEK